MVPQSGRIKKSSLEIISKMMQIFTLSYVDSDKVGPAFYFLFTDFSRDEQEKNSDDYFSYKEETPEEEKEKEHLTKTPAA